MAGVECEFTVEDPSLSRKSHKNLPITGFTSKYGAITPPMNSDLVSIDSDIGSWTHIHFQLSEFVGSDLQSYSFVHYFETFILPRLPIFPERWLDYHLSTLPLETLHTMYALCLGIAGSW